MDWGLLISQPDTPWINMGTDECLLQWVGQTGRPIMRFYSWDRKAVSFGYFQAYEDIASWTPVRPLVRRPTGGGLVSHVADLTYSVAIPDHHEWYRLKACVIYCRIHRWVNQALNDLNIPSKLANQAIPTGPGQCFLGAEENDILLNGFKIEGKFKSEIIYNKKIIGIVKIIKPAFIDPTDKEKSSKALNASDPKILESVIGANETHLYKIDEQHGNWLDCIETRKAPISRVDIGHRACSVCLISHIAMKIPRKLEWNPKTEMFVNDNEANAFLSRPQRKPYGTNYVK